MAPSRTLSVPTRVYGRPALAKQEPQQLADILERVLDKGIVIVGDIQVRLLDVELLTIKLRLVVASVERAREMGIDWWTNDSFVSSGTMARRLRAGGKKPLRPHVSAPQHKKLVPTRRSSRGTSAGRH
jgi:hypothetical protein